MKFMEFASVQWVIWCFQTRPELILLVLILIIVYYNIKQKYLKEPEIINHPKSSSDQHEREKKAYTAKKIKELEESEDFQIYKRDKITGRLRLPQEDETTE